MKNSLSNLNLIKTLAILFLILIYDTQSCSYFKKESRIKVRRNGYMDLVVGIEEGVQEDHLLIERIKESFIEASNLLFNITKKRVYFREVVIVIPSTWNLEHYYDDFSQQNFDGKIPNATWESFDRGDFCIENRDLTSLDTPFVVNYANDCGGQAASHISLTPDYFLNKNRANKFYGSYANVLVHNWAQFRYGVFNEIPVKNFDSTNEFYLNHRGEIEATRCSLNLTGRIKNPLKENGVCDEFTMNGLPNRDCIFEDDQSNSKNSNDRFGSLLYKPFLSHLNEFCDDADPNANLNLMHNALAPTIQNLECNRKSIWRMMREHDDFNDFKNMPNSMLKSSVPKFQLLKNRVNKIVLVIDKNIFNSKSSAKTERALKDYIKNMVGDGSLLGIVHFENFARISYGMTIVKDSSSRKRLLEQLIPIKQPIAASTNNKNPNNSKKSNIWNAISLSLTLLRTTMNTHDKISPTGGKLIIITNSFLDNKYPNKKEVMKQIKDNDLLIDLLRVGSGEGDEPLEDLVAQSSGKTLLIDEINNPLLDLNGALAFVSNREKRNVNKIVELLNKKFHLDFSSSSSSTSSYKLGYILIDETITQRHDSLLRLSFQVQNMKEYLEINVYEPNNRKHQSKYNVRCKDSSILSYDLNLQEVECEFKRPRTGKWIYEIKGPAATNKAVNNQDSIEVSFKASVYYQYFMDENSYYSNYYDRDEFQQSKNRKKRGGGGSDQVEEDARAKIDVNYHNEIRLEGKWKLDVVNYPKQTQQIIYASLSKGLKPILNASVKAFIYRPSGDVLSLELKDNGLNADRFKNDGIYTRQFSNFNLNGTYFARIEASSLESTLMNTQQIVGNPQMEHYPKIGLINRISLEDLTNSVQDFQRTFFIGHFILDNFISGIDYQGPSKIKDLRILESDLESKVVKLGFTAPGDDADLGSAFYYEIKCSHDVSFLIDYENDTHPSSEFILPLSIASSSFKEGNTPNQGGSDEFFVLNTNIYSSDEEILSIKIRAFDSHGNQGEWSNLVIVKLNSNIKLSPYLKHFNSDNVLNSNKDDENITYLVEKSLLLKMKEDRYFYYFLVFIACLGLILLMQIFMITVLTIKKMRYAKETSLRKSRNRRMMLENHNEDKTAMILNDEEYKNLNSIAGNMMINDTSENQSEQSELTLNVVDAQNLSQNTATTEENNSSSHLNMIHHKPSVSSSCQSETTTASSDLLIQRV